MDKDLYAIILLSLVYHSVCGAKPCIPRDYGKGNIVCVCNATYCDTVDPIETLPSGKFKVYTTSKMGLRFSVTYGTLEREEASNTDLVFYIDRSQVYQTMKGFGGALTDSACINILSLSKNTQELLLRSYYSSHGNEYNINRIPIGGTDFSIRRYTYDDNYEDPDLSKFALASEDIEYKIPVLQRAMNISEQKILLFASTWNTPIWMKTNKNYYGLSLLKREYYATWAQYIIKFLDSYAKKNITFWAVTTGNEPITGLIPFRKANSLGWTPEGLREWIKQYFGPILYSSNHRNILIIGNDDNRIMLPIWVSKILKYKDTTKYINGLGIHWYSDSVSPSSKLEEIHAEFPDKFLLYTEACNGAYPWEPSVAPGSWARGVSYLESIIKTVNKWVEGWVDWNMVLDLRGGPTWVGNNLDSPILVDAGADEFYKQPMFYALGHVSKFVKRNSTRIYINPESHKKIRVMAVKNPDNGTVVVFLNKNGKEKTVGIKDIQTNRYIQLTLPPDSFVTLIYYI